MKRLIYMAIVAMTALAVSCNKENSGNTGGDDGIIGTWLMRVDEYHYFDATFKKDGSYVWEWKGAGGRLQDTGSYTYENNVVTMTASKFYEEDYETEEMKAADMPQDWSRVRTVTFVENLGPVAWWTWSGDHFAENSSMFGGDDPVIVFKEGADLGIKSGDLKGTWEAEFDGWTERIIFEDGTFTWYSLWKSDEAECGYSLNKDTGTWTLKGNALSFDCKKAYYSFAVFYNPGTQKNEYTYYDVKPDTFEAEKWRSVDQEWSQTYYIYIKGKELFLTRGTYTKK